MITIILFWCTLLQEPIAFEAKNNFWILSYGQFKEDNFVWIARYATGNNDGANVRTPDDGSPKKDIPYINYTECSVLNERECSCVLSVVRKMQRDYIKQIIPVTHHWQLLGQAKERWWCPQMWERKTKETTLELRCPWKIGTQHHGRAVCVARKKICNGKGNGAKQKAAPRGDRSFT